MRLKLLRLRLFAKLFLFAKTLQIRQILHILSCLRHIAFNESRNNHAHIANANAHRIRQLWYAPAGQHISLATTQRPPNFVSLWLFSSRHSIDIEVILHASLILSINRCDALMQRSIAWWSGGSLKVVTVGQTLWVYSFLWSQKPHAPHEYHGWSIVKYFGNAHFQSNGEITQRRQQLCILHTCDHEQRDEKKKRNAEYLIK